MTQNPFPSTDPTRAAIWDMHIRDDIDAFIAGDWSAIEDTFVSDGFIALDANRSSTPGDWRIAFHSLDAYRDEWLRQSQDTLTKANPETLRTALFDGTSAQRIDFYQGDTAILHKRFDGVLPLRDGRSERFQWQSVFTLRQVDSVWKVVSFVGYLPL